MHDRSLLFCTWGSDGASCLSLPSGRCLSCAASPEGREVQVVEYVGRVPGIAEPTFLKEAKLTYLTCIRSTVGAGDTFIAGMLFSLLIYDADWTLQRKLQFAVQLATCKVQREGFQGLGQYVTV